MARSDKWRNKTLNSINNLLGVNPAFDTRLREIIQLEGNEARVALLQLLTDFDLSDETFDYFLHFIKTGKRDEKLIRPAITIVSEYDRMAYPSEDPKIAYEIYEMTRSIGSGFEVRIVLGPNSSRTEIAAALKDNWDHIEELLQNATASRTRGAKPRPKEREHQYILHLLNEGHSPRDIEGLLKADDTITGTYTAADIRVIRNRKQKDDRII